MGGEGAMMAAITSLKNNSRRHKRVQFDKDKVGGYANGEKLQFDVPEVTPEVLRNIRDRLQKERRQLLWKRGVLLLIIALILIILFFI